MRDLVLTVGRTVGVENGGFGSVSDGITMGYSLMRKSVSYLEETLWVKRLSLDAESQVGYAFVIGNQQDRLFEGDPRFCHYCSANNLVIWQNPVDC